MLFNLSTATPALLYPPYACGLFSPKQMHRVTVLYVHRATHCNIEELGKRHRWRDVTKWQLISLKFPGSQTLWPGIIRTPRLPSNLSEYFRELHPSVVQIFKTYSDSNLSLPAHLIHPETSKTKERGRRLEDCQTIRDNSFLLESRNRECKVEIVK